MRPGEKAKRERASELETPTDPALPPPPPPPPRPGPTWRPSPSSSSSPPHGGRCPAQAGGPDLSSGSGRRWWRRCGVAARPSGEHGGGEGVDGGRGDGGGGDSDGGGGGVPGTASIVPLSRLPRRPRGLGPGKAARRLLSPQLGPEVTRSRARDPHRDERSPSATHAHTHARAPKA